MALSVTILGNSSALPTSERFPTAHLVNHDERFFLIDCGEGTQIQLRRFKKPFNKINHIFISHLHGDHVFGLFGLLSSFSLLARKNDLHIYSHELLEEILDTHLHYFDQDLKYKIIFHHIDTKKQELIYEDKKLTVSTIPLKHRIPCVGFLFQEKPKERKIIKQAIVDYHLSIAEIVKLKKGEDIVRDHKTLVNESLTMAAAKPLSYAFCTDTLYKENIVSYIQQVHLLYFEATFLHDHAKLAKSTYHCTAIQAATLARNANVGKLIIGHFSSRYKNIVSFEIEARTIFAETYLAIEGKEFEVE